MTDLVPMLAGEPTELEGLLLRAAADDEPAAGALERAGAALGVGSAALAVSAGGARAGQAAAAGKAAALSKPLTFASLAKWLAVGIGAGMATGGVAQVASRAVESAPPAVVAPAATMTPEPAAAVAPALTGSASFDAPEAEATLLRVDALLRSGNRPAAEREARALMSAAPGSRYAIRARELLGLPPE